MRARDVECAVTDAHGRGEIGLLRPHGGWGTFLRIVHVPPPPWPPVKNTANDHTPASLKEKRRLTHGEELTASSVLAVAAAWPEFLSFFPLELKNDTPSPAPAPEVVTAV